VKVGQMQQKLAEAERQFVQSSITNFLLPLKAFLDGDMKIILKERKSLETKRLDLDAAKTKFKRAKTDTKEAVETDLRVAQGEFDRQVEVTKLLLEAIASSHAQHLHNLSEFVTGQATYYAQCNHYMTDLQKQLGSVSTSAAGE
jgi:endophilin-B1